MLRKQIDGQYTASLQPSGMKKADAAYYCGLSVRTFERLVASGEIRPRRVGSRTIIYLRSELDEYLGQLPVGGGEMPSVD
ncbi:excisionase family DNA binding protein [Rhodopirellula rubra]|uniref:Excisionase family DNA binding protein n=1 Tax=Aporhodopirellula rubra TaxID=980271 RepID=A0A7W5E0C3_9BACT|nr:helix-turn-helix domain-containing protein [Aporhodopirellula rubra]MBB3207484.1 excisionase family DNA binding protein [Aporhodopirellula rubra]